MPAKEIRGRKFYPKMLFWLQAMDVIAQHEYVWLADEDISFRGFALQAYWQRLQLAFGSRGPPVISQPTIATSATVEFGDPRGKWIEFLNTDEFWRDTGIAAAEVSYTEQQAALVDARFFVREHAAWEALAQAQHQAGSDFALDSLWCGAATLYAPSRVACAIINVPIDHDDTRALNWTSDASFWSRSRRLEKLAYTKLAPSWWERTQRLRLELAMRQLALFEASNHTCLAPRVKQTHAHKRGLGRRNLQKRVRAATRATGRHLEQREMALATALPCQLTQLERFPMQYNRVGDAAIEVPLSDETPRSHQQVLLSPNQTATAQLMRRAAQSPLKSCCKRGVWKCCY